MKKRPKIKTSSCPDFIRSGYHDGYFGIDLKEAAKAGYNYIENGKGCNTWYMAIVDPDIAADCTRLEETGTNTPEGAFHALGNEHMFDAPKHGKRVMKGKIDRDYPGANIYILPQIMKREYVSNREYFSMPEEERFKFRTDRPAFKNDWKRAEIKSAMFAAKAKSKKYGTIFNQGYYNDLIASTRTDDERHPLTGHVGYTEKDILAYRCIVMDIDNHEFPPEYTEQLADGFAKILIRGCDENGEMIADVLPNWIVKTGRGLQLWFFIDPVYFPAASMVRKAADALCDMYQKIVDRFCPDLDIDRAATTNISGFKRMPGTRNFSAPAKEGGGRWGYKTSKYISKVRGEKAISITEMYEKLGLKTYTAEERASYKASHKKRYTPHTENSNITAVNSTRPRTDSSADNDTIYTGSGCRGPLLGFFDAHVSEVTEGDRNVFVFVASTVANEAGRDVDQYALDLNSRLKRPLDNAEVLKTARSVKKHNYHYRIDTMADKLGVAVSELCSYSSYDGSGYIPNPVRDEARREKREERDRQVEKMLTKGNTVSATARECGLSRATVRRIRDAIQEKKAATVQALKKKMAVLAERNTQSKAGLKKLFGQVVSCRTERSDYENRLPFMTGYIRLTS